MNASSYLLSYGWKEGEALQKGSLKKPILVRHKMDSKGLGEGNDLDKWWERLFDGQLKSLEVNSGVNGVSISQNKKNVEDHMRKASLPLNRMFVKGEGLAGTVGKTENAHVKSTRTETIEAIDKVEKSLTPLRKEKREKKDKKEKKETKAKKVKLDKVDNAEDKRGRKSNNEELKKENKKKKSGNKHALELKEKSTKKRSLEDTARLSKRRKK